MIADAREVRLEPEGRAELEARLRMPTLAQRDALRARIVLKAAGGEATRKIARDLGVMPRTVSLWRNRFADEGIEGLAERPRPAGKASAQKYGASTNRRILDVLAEPPPKGMARWTGGLIAEALGDVSDQYVWRFLREQKIDLDATKSWCLSDDPDFVAKCADIVGLYLDPPDGALVLSFDEKPHIQALERAQGYLTLLDGRTLTGRSHDYKRHGTTTLFAALDVATGAIRAGHYRRRRRVEFLDFMNAILAEHTNVHFHYTPTTPRG